MRNSPAARVHPTMRRYGCDVLFDTGQSARSTSLQFRTRLPVRSHFHALDSDNCTSVAVASQLGRGPWSVISSVCLRRRSCELIGHVFGPSSSVALVPRRSPATSSARRGRPRHSRFYDLVLRLMTSSETTMLHTSPSPHRPTQVILPLRSSPVSCSDGLPPSSTNSATIELGMVAIYRLPHPSSSFGKHGSDLQSREVKGLWGTFLDCHK